MNTAHKSSFCVGGSCIEVKASKSGFQGNCIDVDSVGLLITVRETDDPTRTIYTTRENFQAFIEGVKAGEFDQFGMPVMDSTIA